MPYNLGGQTYSDDQIKQYFVGKTPDQIAKDAASLGLNANQIADIARLGGQNVSANDISSWGSSNGYNFNGSGARDAAPVSQPGTGDGMWAGGNWLSKQQVQDFYKSGGDDVQWYQQNIGGNDLAKQRDFLLQARQLAGPGTMQGENALRHYYDMYQKYVPGGAFQGDYNGFKNDILSSPGRSGSIESGSYTGQGWLTSRDNDFGGVLGPGGSLNTPHDSSGNGFGALGNGTGWGTGGSSGSPSRSGGNWGESWGSGSNSGGNYWSGSNSGAASGSGASSGSSSAGMSNPYLQPQAQAIAGQYARTLNEDVMPAINQGAMIAGGYGGTRQALAQGKAINGMGLNLASALSNLYGNAYQFDQGNYTNQRGQDLNYGATINGQNLNSQATNRQLDQSGMRLGADLFNLGNSGYLGQGQGIYQIGATQQNAPWLQLQNLSGLTGPYTGLNSTVTSSGNSSGSTLGNLVGGAMLGNKLYSGWGTGSPSMPMVNGGGFSNLPAYLLGS